MRALSIRLRFRWRGAVCYTSHDLRVFLANAAHLLAHLRCPKKSAHPLVLDFFDRCVTIPSLHPPPAALGSHKCVTLARPLAVPEKIIGRSALILDFFDRCAKKSSLPRPPDAVGFLARRATLVGLIIEDREIKPCLYNKKSLTPMV